MNDDSILSVGIFNSKTTDATNATDATDADAESEDEEEEDILLEDE